MTNILDYVRLTRPFMVLCASAAFVAGAVVSGASFSVAHLAYGLVAVVTSVGGWFVLNDVFDRERDMINKPDRAIASGRVRVDAGGLFAALLFAASLLALFQLPAHARIWLVGIAPILIFYSQLKVRVAWLANIATAIVGATMALTGAAMTGHYGYSWLIAAFAFLCILGREIIKDIEDVPGDQAVGLKTVPIIFGKRASLRAVLLLWGALIMIIPFPYALGIFSLGYLFLALMAGLLLSISLSGLNVAMTQKNISTSLRLSQYSLALGIAAFVVAV